MKCANPLSRDFVVDYDTCDVRDEPTHDANRKGDGMRRHSIARMTYGAPKSETDASTTGRVAKARNLRVRKIADVEMSACCGAPQGYCLCDARNARRPRPDSVMEVKLFRSTKSRTILYKAKGRLA